MLKVKHDTVEILMTINYYWSQLDHRLGWTAAAYFKNGGATRRPGMRKHDGNCDWCFGLWLGKWNLGSLSGRGREVYEELKKRMIDVCPLQEVRWQVYGSWMLGMDGRRYKLW